MKLKTKLIIFLILNICSANKACDNSGIKGLESEEEQIFFTKDSKDKNSEDYLIFKNILELIKFDNEEIYMDQIISMIQHYKFFKRFPCLKGYYLRYIRNLINREKYSSVIAGIWELITLDEAKLLMNEIIEILFQLRETPLKKNAESLLKKHYREQIVHLAKQNNQVFLSFLEENPDIPFKHTF